MVFQMPYSMTFRDYGGWSDVMFLNAKMKPKNGMWILNWPL